MNKRVIMVAILALTGPGCGYGQQASGGSRMMNHQHSMMGAPQTSSATHKSSVPHNKTDADNGAPNGGRLTRQACGACHTPPRPSAHSPGQWPAVVQRMQHYRHRYGWPKLSNEQIKAILHYLQTGVADRR